MVGTALLVAVGCAGRSSEDACPPTAVCAIRAPFSAEEVVHAPAVCRGEFAASMERAGLHAGGAVAVAVDPWWTKPPRERVTAYSLARSLLSFAGELSARGQRLVAVIEAAETAEGCDAPAVEVLAEQLSQMADDGPVVGLYCRAGPGEPVVWRVEAATRDAPSSCVRRGRFTCADQGLADLDVATMESARDAVGGAPLAGFLVGGEGAPSLLGNGDFALGFAGWATSGAVALRSRGRPDECTPLVAELGPGASLRSSVRTEPGAQTVSGGPWVLGVDLEPAPVARELLVSSNGGAIPVAVSAGASEVRVEFAELPTDVRVAPGGDASFEIHSVRLQARDPSGARAERIASALETLSARGDVDPGGRSNEPMRLVEELRRARVSTSGEDFVRVERFGSDDPTLRNGILAHPGTDRATRLEFDLGSATCDRRFEARVTLAPDCRAESDGVRFRARVGDQVATAEVGGTPAGEEPAPFAEIGLDLAVTGADASSGEVLVLETESGPAGDTSCDWALWVEPTVFCRDPAVGSDLPEGDARERTIDVPPLADRGTPIQTAWDEANVWKLYAFFGPQSPKPRRTATEPNWLVRRLPWLSHVRVLAALGGNTCRHIRPVCERSERTDDHPFDPPCWEGQHGRAAAYEILHDEETPRIDTTVWGQAVDEILSSGVKPHLNLSAAPCLLTGGHHHYRDYHWNQVPVVDREGYGALLGVFGDEVEQRGDWSAWRLSIVNEPNCLWIAPPEGSWPGSSPEIAHIGFTGEAETYADHFASTASFLRERLPGIQLHIGNFTIGGKFPLEDNLAEYLGILAPALDEAGVPAGDLSALSFSLYESPQHGLGDLPAYKFGIVDRARSEDSPFHGLPIKVDEVEIHPLVVRQFREDTGGDLDSTRWAAAWHADMAAMAIDTGIQSLAPWLGRMIPDDELNRPFPKYWAYGLLSLATGQAAVADGPLGDASEWELRDGSDRASAPRLLALHRASEDRDGLGWLITREPATGDTWVALWRHANAPMTDERANEAPPLEVRLRLGAASAARDAVEALSIGPVFVLDTSGRARPTAPRPWQLSPFETTAVQSWETDVDRGELHLSLGQESIVLLRLASGGDGASGAEDASERSLVGRRGLVLGGDEGAPKLEAEHLRSRRDAIRRERNDDA